MTERPTTHNAGERRWLDSRVVVFVGFGLLILLAASVPGNPWALQAAMGAGLSDPTEILVLCAALAIGALLLRPGRARGTARVLHRGWRGFGAPLGLVIAVVAMPAALDLLGFGAPRSPDAIPFLGRAGGGPVALLMPRFGPDLVALSPTSIYMLALCAGVVVLRRPGRAAVAGVARGRLCRTLQAIAAVSVARIAAPMAAARAEGAPWRQAQAAGPAGSPAMREAAR